jgi:DNA repair protein RecO (recombination protein O)
MLTQDEGIVLRHIALGETSWIASLLTSQCGRIRLVARGARTPRSRLGPLLELGNDLDLVFDLRPGRDLGYLREASVRQRPLAGARDLAAIAVGMAILEILERAIPEGAGDAGLLATVRAAHGSLRSTRGRSQALVVLYAFERRLLDRLGLGTDFDACEACSNALEAGGMLSIRAGTMRCRSCHGGGGGGGGIPVDRDTLHLLRALGTCSWEGVVALGPSTRTRHAAGSILHRLLGMHLEKYRLPESLRMIQKVDTAGCQPTSLQPGSHPIAGEVASA